MRGNDLFHEAQPQPHSSLGSIVGTTPPFKAVEDTLAIRLGEGISGVGNRPLDAVPGATEPAIDDAAIPVVADCVGKQVVRHALQENGVSVDLDAGLDFAVDLNVAGLRKQAGIFQLGFQQAAQIDPLGADFEFPGVGPGKKQEAFENGALAIHLFE